MKIALNADVGEGMESDSDLMKYLTYANIACGGHFGNSETIKEAIQLAKINGVKIGAHPSYPDTENFGRKSLNIDRSSLEDTLLHQINEFLEISISENIQMHHIKLHGALYNDVFQNEKLTVWFLNWVNEKYKNVRIFVPVAAKEYIENKYQEKVIYEAFADRNYNAQLQLISRSHNKASITDPNIALKHVKSMFEDNVLISIEGGIKQLKADTFCLHGDNLNALLIAEKIHELYKY